MANQGYFPSSEADRTAWLAHFRTKLPVHCVNLGFSLDDIAGTLADIDFYIWLLQSWTPSIQKNAMEASAFKALIGTGSGSDPNYNQLAPSVAHQLTPPLQIEASLINECLCNRVRYTLYKSPYHERLKPRD